MKYLYQRYFLKESLKVALLFLGCFYFLYVLIDYSAHTKALQQDVSLSVFYYLLQFSMQADKLLPFALLLATLKVLTSSALRGEIVALLVGGVTKQALMRPFLCLAASSGLLLALNGHFLQREAGLKIEAFEEKYFKEGAKKPQVRHELLEDGSELLFGSSDVFWIKSPREILHMKRLDLNASLGEHVNQIERDGEGKMRCVASYETLALPQMRLSPKERSFTFESFAPLLVCLLAAIAPAPFCLRFGRNMPVFFLYAWAIFGMITLFTTMGAAAILGVSPVVPPALLLLFFGWRYAKL